MSAYPTEFNFIKCLDKGFVALIDRMGNDHTVASRARVLPEAKWRPDLGDGKENDVKLINTLVRDFHTTPLEKVQFEFWVKAPIFVYRQWHRHRVWSYQEQSARYMVMDGEFYIPEPELIGEQNAKSHQSRDINESDEDTLSRRRGEVSRYHTSCQSQYEMYLGLIKSGWPREMARACLPVSLYSQMTASVNLWNLMKFWQLRSDSHAQYEIRVYSDAMKELVKYAVPVCMEAWNRHHG